MGALCWVPPQEEEEEEGEVLSGASVLEPLLDQTGCCLSCQRRDDTLMILVTRASVCVCLCVPVLTHSEDQVKVVQTASNHC